MRPDTWVVGGQSDVIMSPHSHQDQSSRDIRRANPDLISTRTYLITGNSFESVVFEEYFAETLSSVRDI